MKEENEGLDVEKIIRNVVIGVFILILIVNTFVIVGAGQRGVVFNRISGVEENVFGEGFHLRIPFVQKVIKMEVRTQKIEVAASSASKDLQDVTTTIALNFHLSTEETNNLYQEIGKAYRERIIDPAIQEGVKAVTAKYTAEELITRRPEVRNDMKEFLREKLKKSYIIVDDFNIVNFQFSEQFTVAIEAKVTAEQQALKAERDLDRIKVEAQQIEAQAVGVKNKKIEEATGEAESIRLIEQQLSKSPKYIDWLTVTRWDGILPKVTGGAIPFVDVMAVSGDNQ
ncbi:hypothetical protein LCGC14_2446190 [marine sediment metagenome]|uniref:Band 7 domain-containing protein n=1 Tax=marine sediment metagenome TaxID=412755 RepID=A0A0F9BHM6_9ZZZZ